MVSYIKGGMQAKGIWKQDPEAKIIANSNISKNFQQFGPIYKETN